MVSKRKLHNNTLNNDTINEEVFAFFEQKAKLSEQELARSFTTDELISLCKKYECRVDMWKWNPVDEMREKLQEDGRFKNRSLKYCLRLIAKGVTKHKQRIMYNFVDIQKIRFEDWGLRKRASILYLDNLKEKNHEILPQLPPHCAIFDSPEVFTYIESPIQNHSQMVHENNIPNGKDKAELVKDLATIVNLQECFVTSSQSDCLTQLNSEEIRQLNANEEVCNLFNINTGSLTFTEEEIGFGKSEEVLSPNYDDFNKRISSTSTQSQQLDKA